MKLYLEHNLCHSKQNQEFGQCPSLYSRAFAGAALGLTGQSSKSLLIRLAAALVNVCILSHGRVLR